MCDLNWCPVCDKAIPCESDSLYCSLRCLKCDANNNINHSFHSFLAPRSCLSSSFNVRHPSSQNNDLLPALSSSISLFTNSTISTVPTSTTFNRRTDFMSKGLFKTSKDKDDEDELLSCCDYCENLLSEPYSVPVFNEPINLTIK